MCFGIRIFEKDFSFAGFYEGDDDWRWFEEMFQRGIRQLNGD